MNRQTMVGLRRVAALLLLLLSFAALGAEAEILVAVEKLGDAFLVDATVAIQVPLRTAWEVLTDFDNMVHTKETRNRRV